MQKKENLNQVKKLLTPPRSKPNNLIPNLFDESAQVGIPVSPFPTWVVCPQCRLLAPLKSGLFELKRDRHRPDQNRYIHSNCHKFSPTVIPARFLVACQHGHLDDFPWRYFVHKGNSNCKGSLRLYEQGISGSATDIEVRCDGCSKSRRLSDAFGELGKMNMPQCRGRHPHLRNFAEDGCTEQMKSILLGASNSWFPITTPEWQVFSNVNTSLNNADFRLTSVAPPDGYEAYFEKVVLVERLREVRALVGFTRIESPGDYAETGELPEEYWDPLSRSKPTWVPASEVRGEGIFMQFQEQVLQKLLSSTPRLKNYEQQSLEAHRRLRRARSLDPDTNFPGIRYILLHSFAHALMRQLVIECGYNAASLRERIYSKDPNEDNGPMAGVLIYTAAPDSEGTLGGLVSLGEPGLLGRHIDQALEQIGLCASDPLCAEHSPLQNTTSLHWAACHACLFSPETSCERGNKYLDRTLLIPTMNSDLSELAFFQ
ncbi:MULTISPECIES: DUF1998 domain-containing protein [unclassified Microcoleus]|uniref:DUF1998 domain-containing protein n=1 Tax=unclassified Microcoleus TaxID=2642155 RepID=UPI002FD09945